jgi:hypothetical protein
MLFWNRLKVVAPLSCAVFMYACETPKAAIDSAAVSISNDATESKLLAAAIVTDTLEPETASKAVEIGRYQDGIIKTTSEVRTHLHGVENTTPWWAQLLQQGFLVVALIGVVILLWQTGVGMFIKKIFWSFGLFIPSRAMRSAEVDLKAASRESTLSFNETVAVRRTSDPAYEYARRKLKKKDF